MTARLILAAVLVAVLAAAGLLGGGSRSRAGGEGYAPGVGPDGKLSVPAVDFRKDWALLGSYAIAGPEGDGEHGVGQFHVVYTQPETVAYYRELGRFPDGAVLVKELFRAASDDLTTGRASWAAEPAGWFVMVKDEQGRFAGDPLWGDGWGWALFEPGRPDASVTTDYRTDCLACHEPARATDLVYAQGYPALKGAGR